MRSSRSCERATEGDDAGAGVEDDDAALGRPQLDARRVAAVEGGPAPRRRQRAPRPPERRLHRVGVDFPEHGHGAELASVLADEREGGDVEGAAGAVEAVDDHAAVLGVWSASARTSGSAWGGSGCPCSSFGTNTVLHSSTGISPVSS